MTSEQQHTIINGLRAAAEFYKLLALKPENADSERLFLSQRLNALLLSKDIETRGVTWKSYDLSR